MVRFLLTDNIHFPGGEDTAIRDLAGLLMPFEKRFEYNEKQARNFAVYTYNYYTDKPLNVLAEIITPILDELERFTISATQRFLLVKENKAFRTTNEVRFYPKDIRLQYGTASLDFAGQTGPGYMRPEDIRLVQ